MKFPWSKTTLEYVTSDGKKKEEEIGLNAKRIPLEGKDIADIDLSPLSECEKLESLRLEYNHLGELDLSSLSSCKNLRRLFLGENHLGHVNLSPLASCKELELLDLTGNHLGHVNLSPLASCKKLEGLGLSFNDLESIDLSPLASCKKLEGIALFGNYLKSVNLLPLASCDELTSIWLSHNELESVNLAPLRSCQKLETLALDNNKLGKIDVSPLLYCKSLNQLDGQLEENGSEREVLVLPESVTLVAERNLRNKGKLAPVFEGPDYDIKWLSSSKLENITSRESFEVTTAEKPAPSTDTVELEPKTNAKASSKAVQALRGCELVGGAFKYKVKVMNNTDYVITDVTANVIRYPRDCLTLSGKATKRISRISAGEFRSPEFEFSPSKDCVEGSIVSTVTYFDHKDKAHTLQVEPYTIRSVCDLLQPEEATTKEFELILDDMSGSSEKHTLDWNAEILFSKALALLPNKNFHVVDSASHTIAGQFDGSIRAFAKGKYTNKRVGIQLLVQGSPDGSESQVTIEGLGEDTAMVPTTIHEISSDIRSWTCMNCGGCLEAEEVSLLKQGKPVRCRFCKHTLSIELYQV